MSNEWQYYLLKFISKIITLLPYRLLLALGKLLGKLYYHIAARQRQRALQQIKSSLNLADSEAEKVIYSLFGKLGQTFLEVMYMPKLNKANIDQYVTMENTHHLDNALAKGKGAIILAAHMGNWEWLGATLALYGVPLASVIKRQPNDQQTRLLNEFRVHVGMEVFSKGTTELVCAARALKKGKALGLVADQDAGNNGLFIEFLGKMASTPMGPAVFAKKFKAPVIPCFILRKPQGGHRVIVHEPIYYQDTGNEAEDIYNITLKMTTIVENFIRQYPDEWIWFQKRWNTKYTQTVTAHENKQQSEKEGNGEQA